MDFLNKNDNKLKNKLSKSLQTYINLSIDLQAVSKSYQRNAIEPLQKHLTSFLQNQSKTNFVNVCRVNDEFLAHTGREINRILLNYDKDMQKHVFQWLAKYFKLISAAIVCIINVYELAYSIARTDEDTVKVLKEETNPFVKIQRNYILSEPDYITFKRQVDNGGLSCKKSFVYIEKNFLQEVSNICARKKYTNARDICQHNANLIAEKINIQNKINLNKLNEIDLANYLTVWTKCRETLLHFIFTNFFTLYNSTLVKCLETFLSQQHQLAYDYKNRYEKIVNEKKIKAKINNPSYSFNGNDINDITPNDKKIIVPPPINEAVCKRVINK
ncbi:tegument protein [Glossina pallidipes salivary gland hypertrophy virus]|uniref:Tegument protein n=2 Tax=Glossina hytrovirus (isolate Glossina pallidipes/Ethiopia/Seibersdorf/-) TaxID=379529 RepID=A0A0Y0KFX4_GHVS|nr:hypothetical protein SGHV093 [Glossina pallidipes salivary gland hypertrophy virus]ABQ08866.1 hypothetical protein SGHV093 [Glossina pallidipes salivary gland hypertrophy virus]AMB48706.1 tegument protein [Glossina pallidipes salivary gland hypertrophy virus]